MARKLTFEQELRQNGIRLTKNVKEELSNYMNGQSLIDDITRFADEYGILPKNVSVTIMSEPSYYDSYDLTLEFEAEIKKTQDELQSELNERKTQLLKEQERQDARDKMEFERLQKKFEKEQEKKTKKTGKKVTNADI